MVRFIPTTTATAATLWVLASMIGCGSPSPTNPTDDQGLIEVRFNHRTPVDEPANHLTLLYREPREELILPEDVDTSDAWFFDVYYTRTGNEDFTISGMMIPSPDGDAFFVDLNNDEHLTNDGEPLVMAKTDDGITFEVLAPDDPRQRAVYQLNRAPAWTKESHRQEVHDAFFDENGNLPPEGGKHCSLGRTGYATRTGLFFFDRRVALTRGHLPVDGEDVAIGIFDYDNNGLFNDPDDFILVDLDRDGLLTFLFSTEGFALADPFLIDDTWFRLVESDRYGESAVFEVVDPPAETETWLNAEGEAMSENNNHLGSSDRDLVETAISRPGVPGVRVGSLDPEFWETTFEGTHSEILQTEDFRGDFLLLNFWGEWCAPCVAEIPDLVAASSRYSSDGLKIISFLESQSPDHAEGILAKFGADWPQVPFTDTYKNLFRINAFPTNLLILPDGTTYVSTASVNEQFFETFIEKPEILGTETFPSD